MHSQVFKSTQQVDMLLDLMERWSDHIKLSSMELELHSWMQEGRRSTGTMLQQTSSGIASALQFTN
eukprot:10194697-Ditylum_brightwellii.AAC.1